MREEKFVKSMEQIIMDNLLPTSDIAPYFIDVSFQLKVLPNTQKKTALSVSPEYINDQFSAFKYQGFLEQAFLHALRYVRDIKGDDNREYSKAMSHFRSDNNQGKVGELFLCIFLNHFFKALRVGSKVEFCSPSEQIKGLDALHVCWDDTNKRPHLILGESKFYKEFDLAVRDAFSSLSKYIDNQWRTELSQFYNHKSEEMANLLGQIKQAEGLSLSTVVFIVWKNAKMEYYRSTAVDKEKLSQEIQTMLEEGIAKIKNYDLSKDVKSETKKPYENAQKFIKNTTHTSHLHFIIFPLPMIDSFEEALYQKAGVTLKNEIRGES